MFKVRYKFAKTDNFTLSTGGPYLTREDAERTAERLRSYGLTMVKVLPTGHEPLVKVKPGQCATGVTKFPGEF